MLTRADIQNMNEDELRKQVLIPLLKAMKFNNVVETHGAGEKGKDIVCWKPDELGARVNYAIVAKAARLSGKVSGHRGSVNEVHMQIQQCFGTPFVDTIHGSEQQVHRVWVISNRPSTSEAVESLKSSLTPHELERNISIIDGDMLWDLVKKKLAEARLQELHETGMWLDSLDSHYRVSAKASGPRITFGIEEKFPGAALEKPLTAKARYMFPDTEEGRARREAFRQHIAKGTPVEIPAAFVEFSFPELLQNVWGDSSSWKTISLGPITSPESLLVRVEIHSDDGGGFRLGYVDLRETQGGTEELTFTNDHQPIPERLKLVLNRQTGKVNFTMNSRQYGLNVKQILDSLRMQQAMSKGGLLRFFHFDSDLRLLEVPISAGSTEPPDADQLAAIEDFVAIQIKVQRPINLPDRDITPDEMNLLNKLRHILHFGRLRSQWDNLMVDLPAQEARKLLPDFTGGRAQSIGRQDSETVEFFGVELPLGPILHCAPQAILANEEAVNKQLEHAGDDTPVTMRFVPGDDDTYVIDYLNWGVEPTEVVDDNLE
jgi:Restriction endonuclease